VSALNPAGRENCMQKARFLIITAAIFLSVGALSTMLARASAQTAQPGNAAPAATQADMADPGPKIPEGFTPIFNGKDLTGWHVSKTNHHGTTPDYHVLHGLIVGTQNPRGQGGILLTDKKYKNVEVYMEIKPDWGCDSGLFLRSSEAGEAYQVTLDYLPGGGMGGIYGERLTGVQNANASTAKLTDEERAAQAKRRAETWQKAWRREAWNSVRARIVGDVPQITVWINDQLITEFKDTANHAAGGATDGMIAIQMHFSNEKTPRWVDGGFWRWRALAVKELPAQ
jgi:3-keto-disaccharide hydrolase